MPNAAAAAAAASPTAIATAVSPEPSAMWTRGADKLLELLVVRYFPRWDIISRLVGKTPEQAFQRYMLRVDEVTHILDALEVETPREWDMQLQVVEPAPPAGSREAVVPAAAADVAVASAGGEAAAVTEQAPVPTSSAADGEAPEIGAKKRKKLMKWTEEEHSRFLEGLAKYGKGKWKAMSDEYLPTKSASQIASHDQKHRKRLKQRRDNACKRASIHDITEPTNAAAAVVADAGEPAAQKDGLGRGV